MLLNGIKPNQAQDMTALGAPQQPRGFFQRIGGMVQRGATPDQTGVSFFDKLGAFGASLRDDPAIGQYANQRLDMQRANALEQQQLQQAQAEKQARQQEINAMADQLGLNPRERFMLSVNPEYITEIYKNRDRVERGVQGGAAYELGSEGLRNLGGLDISPQQQMGFDLDQQRMAEQQRANQAREAYQRSNLDLARQREKRIASQPPMTWVPAFGVPAGAAYYSDDEVVIED